MWVLVFCPPSSPCSQFLTNVSKDGGGMMTDGGKAWVKAHWDVRHRNWNVHRCVRFGRTAEHGNRFELWDTLKRAKISSNRLNFWFLLCTLFVFLENGKVTNEATIGGVVVGVRDLESGDGVEAKGWSSCSVASVELVEYVKITWFICLFVCFWVGWRKDVGCRFSS